MGGQTYYTSTDNYWAIFKVDDDTLTLIGIEYNTLVDFYLGRTYKAYNNAVYILNDACDSMYSNDYGKARSVNLDDLVYAGLVSVTYTSYNSIGIYAPAIFGLSTNESTDGVTYGSWDPSEQEYMITDTTRTTYSKGTYGFKYVSSIPTGLSTYSLDDYEGAAKLLLKLNDTTMISDIYFFVATRSAVLESDSDNDTHFTLGVYRYGEYNDKLYRLSRYTMYAASRSGSTNTQMSTSTVLKPMVEISLSDVTIGESGDGTTSNPYSIVAK